MRNGNTIRICRDTVAGKYVRCVCKRCKDPTSDIRTPLIVRGPYLYVLTARLNNYKNAGQFKCRTCWGVSTRGWKLIITPVTHLVTRTPREKVKRACVRRTLTLDSRDLLDWGLHRLSI